MCSRVLHNLCCTAEMPGSALSCIWPTLVPLPRPCRGEEATENKNCCQPFIVDYPRMRACWSCCSCADASRTEPAEREYGGRVTFLTLTRISWRPRRPQRPLQEVPGKRPTNVRKASERRPRGPKGVQKASGGFSREASKKLTPDFDGRRGGQKFDYRVCRRNRASIAALLARNVDVWT